MIHRRTLLLQLLGLGAAGLSRPLLAAVPGSNPREPAPFKPLLGPIPLPSDGLSAREQQRHYRNITLVDRLQVPEGYRADVLLSWGDRLGAGVMGFNNDYLAFTAIDAERALLTINFEYISARPWCGGFSEARGSDLPFSALAEALQTTGGAVDVPSMRPGSKLRAMAEQVAAAAMADLGIGVASLSRRSDGSWHHQATALDRRIDGLQGLHEPSQRLRVSGPAAAVFRQRNRLGYNDGLGDQVIGSFANCSGGQTPWGTVLSAEENVQTQVVEAVYADGSSPSPSACPFRFNGNSIAGLGNPFGLAGNKYGWMVEIDPRQPKRPAVKHSWLGRFRHEAVAVRARSGEPLVVYSACDRHSGHLYRFVSDERIGDPKDPANSRLLEAGRLEVAQLQADGTGRWLLLAPETAVAPLRPSHYEQCGTAGFITLPHNDRSQAGGERIESDAELDRYCQRYRTLADLYPGDGATQMGAILIDAHLAANAIGATPTARPEDTEIDPRSGDLLISFTMGGSDETGSADPAVFRGPNGETPWPYGWVMRLSDGTAETSRTGGGFRWQLAATGGPPWEGGLGFSNPDNLAIDQRGNVWMVTDRSSADSQTDLFGNNACWLLPQGGSGDTEALLFASGPMECELTGPCFDNEEATLFLAVQHPGEQNGCHRPGDVEMQAFRLQDRQGNRIEQLRTVPLGSNWPSGVPDRPPRPAVVTIRRQSGGPLLPKG